MNYLDLAEVTRDSLLRGLLERCWHPDGATTPVSTEIGDPVAYTDGRRLRAALDAVVAAGTFAELNVAEQVYDDLAREFDVRYGPGLVVGLDEGVELGLRGFRGQGCATRSSVLLGEERTAS